MPGVLINLICVPVISESLKISHWQVSSISSHLIPPHIFLKENVCPLTTRITDRTFLQDFFSHMYDYKILFSQRTQFSYPLRKGHKKILKNCVPMLEALLHLHRSVERFKNVERKPRIMWNQVEWQLFTPKIRTQMNHLFIQTDVIYWEKNT